MIEYCPNCGEAIEEDGLCAGCLLAGGVQSTASGPESSDTLGIDSGGAENVLEYDNFGPYEIQKVLGEGGMGTVYLARQKEPIQRDVALKVVKPGMDTGHILARFNYERQALAAMDHPNIARVYEAGATAKGRPYFVMEFIDGEPITTYCDRHRLTTAQRLDLFRPVCGALRHAHQRGIIHRDIKPSNVLVTEIDGKAVPKVIDFGIAKAIDQRAMDQTALTQLGQLVGTPEYMSPEAADVMANDIDTSSDVYSLGVMLYELLIGAVPFDGKALRQAGFVELMRIIREVDAPPMTAKLTQLGKLVTAIAECRNTDVAGLKRAIQGDLNWIVSKAVEKNRRRRYASAGELLEDIERHIENRPVKAGPPSQLYRLSKFARRNRAAVGAGLAIAATLAFGVLSTIWQGQEALRQRDRAQAALMLAEERRTEAERQRGLAESRRLGALAAEERAVKGEASALANLQDVRELARAMIFEVEEQVRPLSGATPVRQTLVKLGTEYLEKGGVSGDLLGPAWFRLGELQDIENVADLESARKSYSKSIQLLELRYRQFPDNSEVAEQLARSIANLAKLNFDSGEQLKQYRRAEEILENLLRKRPGHIEALHTLAKVQLGMNQPAQAVNTEKRIEKLGANSFGDQLSRAEILANATMQNEDAPEVNYDRISEAILQVDELLKSTPGNVDLLWRKALWMAHRSSISHVLGRRDEGFREVNEAIQILGRLSAEDPKRGSLQFHLATASLFAGSAQAFYGDPKRAKTLMEDALEKVRDLAQKHPSILQYQLAAARALAALSDAQRIIQETNGGIKNYEQSVAELQTITAKHSACIECKRILLVQLSNLSTRLATAGRISEAERALEAAWKTQNEILAKSTSTADQITSVGLHVRFGSLALSQSKGRAALEAGLAAYQSILQIAGKEEDGTLLDMKIADTVNLLWKVRESHLEYKEAIQFEKESRKFLEQRLAARPTSVPLRRAVWENLRSMRTSSFRVGQNADALETSRRSLELAKRWLQQSPHNAYEKTRLSDAYVNYAQDLAETGQRDQARKLVEQGWSYTFGEFQEVTSVIENEALVNHLSSYLKILCFDLGLPQLAAQGFRHLLPALESLESKQGNTNRTRDLLVEVYGTGADISSAADLLEDALRFDRSALQILKRKTANDPYSEFRLASFMTKIASLEQRLGRKKLAETGWKGSLQALDRSLDATKLMLAGFPSSTGLLRFVWRAQHNIAFLYETLNDTQSALDGSLKAWQRTQDWGKADQDGEEFRIQRRAMLGRLVLAFQAAGRKPEILENGQSLSEDEIQRSMVAGHSARFSMMAVFAIDPARRVAPAELAVSTARDLVRRYNTPEDRSLLSWALRDLASLKQVLAGPRKAADQLNLLADSLKCLEEALTVLRSNHSAKAEYPGSKLDDSQLTLLPNQIRKIEARIQSLREGSREILQPR